jgi:hypothetical protein
VVIGWRRLHNDLVQEPEGKRPLRRPRHRREDIRMDLMKI